MTELNTKYPATQAKPEPSKPGMVIHSYTDVTPHQGEDVHERYIAAQTEEEQDLILRDMPRATVTFYELPVGEPFFDDQAVRPRDANGYALWDPVWIKDAADLGTIEAAHGDEYDVQTSGDLVRLKADQVKPLADLNDEEDAALQRLAAEERTAHRSINV
jgi:hypothetical protein